MRNKVVLGFVFVFLFAAGFYFGNSFAKPSQQMVAEKIDTKEWVLITSTNGQYSLKKPPTWYDGTVCDAENEGGLSLSPIEIGVILCNSDGHSLVNIFWEKSDHPDITSELPENYELVSSTDVVIDGVSGKRTVIRAINDAPDTGYKYRMLKGEEKIYYEGFYKNGKAYTMSYEKVPSGEFQTNVTDEFDTMIQSTFKFSN